MALFSWKQKPWARNAQRAVRWLAVAMLVGFLPSTTQGKSQRMTKTVPGELKSFDKFSDLRHEILDFIGHATKRIWLTTEYLTDGEIVTALYVARYRKIDVQVLLGATKARAYMSRLNYLKNQGIPVYLRPASFQPGQPTVILVDDKVMMVDGELDFLAKYRRFNTRYAEGKEVRAFLEGFAKAARLKIPATPKPIPIVGRAGGRLPKINPVYRNNDPDVYIYPGKPEPRPNGVPKDLPKETLLDRLDQEPTTN